MERKKQRRESTSRTVYIPIAVLIIMFLSIFGTSVFLRITEIEVVGALFYSDEEIISFSGMMPGDNILLIDRLGAQRRIETSLAYISDVRIRRVLPDTIRIEVTERTAMAALRYRGRYLIIDSDGRILQRDSTSSRGLTEIRGFDPLVPEEGNFVGAAPNATARLRAITDMLNAFETDGIQDYILHLDVSNTNNITFRYVFEGDWILDVELGPTADIQRNFRQLSSILDGVTERFPDGATGTINVPARSWVIS